MKAVGGAALLSSLFSLGVGLALALALAIAAGVSLVAVRLASRQYSSLRMEPLKFSGFKGRTFDARLTFEGRKRGAALTVSKVRTQPGLDTQVRQLEDGSFSLGLITRFAGGFNTLVATVRVSDAMGLFFSEHEVPLKEFLLDSIPTSLLQRPRVIPMAAISIGEAPSGSRGSAQEFYAIEDYDSSSDPRGILWKRVAESPTERFVARVGESNIPRDLTVAVIETAPRFETQPFFMDLASEALASIGKEAVEYGITLRVVSEVNGARWEGKASNATEVAACALRIWTDGKKPPPGLRLPDADLVITGLEDAQDPRTMALVANRPSVVVTSGRPAKNLGRKALLYTGAEDPGRILQVVLTG